MVHIGINYDEEKNRINKLNLVASNKVRIAIMEDFVRGKPKVEFEKQIMGGVHCTGYVKLKENVFSPLTNSGISNETR